MPINQTWPDVEELPPPMMCIWCGHVARWIVDGNSACDRHQPAAILQAHHKRENRA